MNDKLSDIIMIDEKDILRLLIPAPTRDEGFRLLLTRFREPIYWHVRRLVVRHEDAQDVMQECFMNVYKYIGNFKGESSLKTWIYKVATNEALRHLSKRRAELESYDEKDGLVNLFASEQGVDFDSAEALLQRAILMLPEKQRVVFNLRYYDQMEYEQVAQVTGSSVATLKVNYHYAKEKIKEYILKNMEG